ncbi:MAG: YbaB/EbfC family nucleoid-associated protein [Bianqueaceae bacterium]
MAKRGGYGGQMPGNMNNLMKQAQKMQRQMEEMQKELETKTVEATAGGEAVKVVVNGRKEVVEIELKPEVVDPEDIEMLQDLVMAAINEGLRKADEMVNSQMSTITGGLNLPGGLF